MPAGKSWGYGKGMMPPGSYDHGTGGLPLVGMTLGEHFDFIAEQMPAAEALVSCHQKISWTYAQLKEKVDLFARGLLKLDITRGDRVGIWSTNNVEWVIVQLATAKIGAILVNINPAYRTGELDYALRQSGVKLLVTMCGYKGDEYLSMLHELAPELMHAGMLNCAPRLGQLQRLVVIEGSPAGSANEKVIDFQTVFALGDTVLPEDLARATELLQFDQAINIQYTSGTTGFPKGVTLSHHNLLNNALYAGIAMAVKPGSRFCVPVPFYHCAGMVLCTLVALNVGAAVVIPGASFDAKATLEAVESCRCTHLAGVPTMFISQLELPDFNNYNLSSLEGGFMAGAPCPVDLMQQVTGLCRNLVIIYGQTECSPVITSTCAEDPLELRATTVGRTIPHMEVKITDAAGNVVPRGQQGEICARGYAVMLGYWENPVATYETIDQSGWLHTGDLGVMSENGYVNITGRKKDMIIRGGENIYPREIEEVLHGHPDIAQAQIFGVPDKHLGEEVAAWLQLKQGSDLEPEQLTQWLNGRVAHFKIPKYIKFVHEYPMTVTGKVQKQVMRAQMIAELNLEEAAKIRTA